MKHGPSFRRGIQLLWTLRVRVARGFLLYVGLLQLSSRHALAARPMGASSMGDGSEVSGTHGGGTIDVASKKRLYSFQPSATVERRESSATARRLSGSSSTAAAVELGPNILHVQSQHAARHGGRSRPVEDGHQAIQAHEEEDHEARTGSRDDGVMHEDDLQDPALAASDRGEPEVSAGSGSWYAPLLQHKGMSGCIIAASVCLTCILLLRHRRSGDASAQTSAEEEMSAESMAEEIVKLRKQRNRVLMDKATSKQRLEKVIIAILELEAQQNKMLAPTSEEVASKVDAAIEANDLMNGKGLYAALAHAAPTHEQLKRLQALVTKRTVDAQEKVLHMAQEEVHGVLSDLEAIFEFPDLQSGIFDQLQNFQLPSIATLLAGTVAPVKLRLFLLKVRFGFASACIFSLTSLAILAVDFKSACPADSYIDMTGVGIAHGSLVYMWFEIDAVMNVLCVLASYRVLSTADTTDIVDPLPVAADDEPLQVLRNLLDFHIYAGSEALRRVDGLSESFAYGFLQWITVPSLLLVCFASEIVLNTDWSECPRPGLVVLRLRVLYFMVMLVPILGDTVLFLVSRYTSSDHFQAKIVSIADGLDASTDSSFPIFTLLAQSLVVRRKRDVVDLQLKLLEGRRSALLAKQEASQKALDEALQQQAPVDTELEKLRQQLEENSLKSPEELKKEEEAVVHQILDSTEAIGRHIKQNAHKTSTKVKAGAGQIEQGEGASGTSAQSLAVGDSQATPAFGDNPATGGSPSQEHQEQQGQRA